MQQKVTVITNSTLIQIQMFVPIIFKSLLFNV